MKNKIYRNHNVVIRPELILGSGPEPDPIELHFHFLKTWL